jgi:hypothetical protein
MKAFACTLTALLGSACVTTLSSRAEMPRDALAALETHDAYYFEIAKAQAASQRGCTEAQVDAVPLDYGPGATTFDTFVEGGHVRTLAVTGCGQPVAFRVTCATGQTYVGKELGRRYCTVTNEEFTDRHAKLVTAFRGRELTSDGKVTRTAER